MLLCTVRRRLCAARAARAALGARRAWLSWTGMGPPDRVLASGIRKHFALSRAVEFRGREGPSGG